MKWKVDNEPEPVPSAAQPTRRERILAALVVGAMLGTVTWVSIAPATSDFAQIWYGARALFDGVSPYSAVGPGRAFPWAWPLFYPLPAVVAAAPLSALPLREAGALFVAMGGGALSFVLTRNDWRSLLLIGSAPVFFSSGTVQWSPLLTAAAIFPVLGFLLAAKPTIGAALWLYNPSRTALLGCIAFVAASIAMQPSWISQWLAGIPRASHMVVPIGHSGGFLLALALLRWKRPEARLLFALACVPQTAALYEAVPLLLIPKTMTEIVAFIALSWVVFVLWVPTHHLPLDTQILMSVRHMVPLLYLPCLIMVLRRPNAGRLPRWLVPDAARSASEHVTVA